MLPALGTIAFVLIPAILIASLWTYVVGFAGAPGALLAMRENESTARFWIGLTLCILGQAYALFAYVAFVVAFIDLRTSVHGVAAWPLWIAGFFFAEQPSIMACRDALRGAQDTREDDSNAPRGGRSVQHLAIFLNAWLTPVSYFVFAFFSHAMIPWLWVPYVARAIHIH